MPLGNITLFLTFLIVISVTGYLAIHLNAAKQYCLVSDFSHYERDHPTRSMQRIISTCIKSLDLLLQKATTPWSRDYVGFFLREPKLLRLVRHVSYHQLLITLNRPVPSKGKTLSYWLATITASTCD